MDSAKDTNWTGGAEHQESVAIAGSVAAGVRRNDSRALPRPEVNASIGVRVRTSQRVDFKAILRGLALRGYSIDTVAMHANIARREAASYASGRHPMHAHGERLIRLWCEVTGNSRDRVPCELDLATVTLSRIP